VHGENKTIKKKGKKMKLKLKLNKEIVVALNSTQMNNLHGGEGASNACTGPSCISCNTCYVTPCIKCKI
jgi:natural product precursor